MSITVIRTAVVGAWVVFAAGLCVGSAAAQGRVGAPGAPPGPNQSEKLDPGPWQESHALKGFAADAERLFFSGDGKSLIALYGDGSLKKWDVATGEEQASLKGDPSDKKQGKETLSLGPSWGVLSPDQKLLARRRADGRVNIWNVATGKLEATLEGHTGPVGALAFSPDGKFLVSGSHDNTIRLWDLDEKKEKAVYDSCTAGSLTFSPDGKTLLANRITFKVFTDEQIKAWKDINRKGGDVSKITGGKDKIVFPAGEHYMYVTDDLDDLLLLEPDTLKERSRVSMAHVYDIVSWPTPKGPALGITAAGLKGAGKLLDPETFKEGHALPDGLLVPGIVGISADGELIAAARDRSEVILPIKGDMRFKYFGRVIVSDGTSGKKLAGIEKGAGITRAALSPDGKTLAANVRIQGAGGAYEYRIQLWQDKTKGGDKK
jgi:WD40 repeat protein